MKAPSNKNLRLFIGERFNDSELDTFCFDYFLEVKNDFTTGMRKTDKVMDLIAYCSRHDLMKNLIISLQQERGELYQQTFTSDTSEQPSKAVTPPLVHTAKSHNSHLSNADRALLSKYISESVDPPLRHRSPIDWIISKIL